MPAASRLLLLLLLLLSAACCLLAAAVCGLLPTACCLAVCLLLLLLPALRVSPDTAQADSRPPKQVQNMDHVSVTACRAVPSFRAAWRP